MNFDTIIVGGGHAGVEAATMASRVGARTALITFGPEDIGTMSCNPAMGGLGKGHLIREIDSLGGIIGRASDVSGIQFRMLNKTRGEAVQGPRAQIDRNKYKKNTLDLASNENISFIYDEVIDVLTFRKGGKEIVDGILTEKSGRITCRTLVITTGTFLSGLIYRGKEKWPAGRLGCNPAVKLADFFKKKHFKIHRLKTGTPPRLIGKSIDYRHCIIQEGDENPEPFSFLTDKIRTKQHNCYITHTNPKTHKIIDDNLDKSPLFNGGLNSKGPRYCPSIEDKVKRFEHKDSHQIFLEPETAEGKIIYPNGISTSLPTEVQSKFLKTVQGLKNVIIDKYGYAIEYDCIESNEISDTYETKRVEGLFLAGQINGTTGYEEAAAQGLLAGINAARKIQGKDFFVVPRSKGYLGVLTSDICKGGLLEPYRMFTSRAEYRLMLRADNADERLTDLGIKIGTVEKERERSWLLKKKKIEKASKMLDSLDASPQTYSNFGLQINLDGKKRTAYEILGYKNATWRMLKAIWPELKSLKLNQKIERQIKVNCFYSRYAKRQITEIEELRRDAKLLLKRNINYDECGGLSNEIKEMLNKHRPASIGEARELPGMTPAAAAILLRHLKK